MLSTLLLALLGTTSAFAADLKNCGASGTDECTDDDGDGYFANPGASTKPAAEDCDDSDKLTFSGAPAALGDNKKNNCDATGADDDVLELAAAFRAVCGDDGAGGDACASADLKISAPAIARRDAFETKYESCTLDPVAGTWGVEGGRYTCVSDSMLPGWTWSKSTGVASKADNAEKRARQSADAALAERLDSIGGVLGTPTIPATGEDHPEIAGTGILGDIESLRKAQKGTDTAVADLGKRTSALETTVNGDGSPNSGLTGRMDRAERGVVAAYDTAAGASDLANAANANGSFTAVDVYGAGLFQPSIVDADGDVVIGSAIGGGGLAVHVGSQWFGKEFGHIFTLDIGVAGGGVETEDGGTLPALIGNLGVSHLWQPPSTNIGVGIHGGLTVDVAGNPVTPAASGWGIGAGGRAIYFFPASSDGRSDVGVFVDLGGSLGTSGTNGNQWLNPAGQVAFGVQFSRGAATPSNW